MSINQQKAINFQINSKAEKKGFQNTLFINVDQKETEGEMNRDNSAELKHNTPKSTISNLSDFKFIGKDLMNKINDISPPLKYIASNLNKISSKDLCIQGEENDENCFNPFFMKSLNSFDSSGGEFYKRNSLANKDCEFNDPERSYTSRNENKQIMINRVDTFSIEEKNSMEELSDEKKDPVVDDIMKAQKQKDIEFVQRPILKTINRNSNGVSQQGNFQEKVKNFNPEFLRDNNVNFPLVAYQQMYYNYLNDMNKENSNAQQFNKNIDYANSAKDCAKVIPNTMEPHPTGRQPIADQECNKANTIINRPEEQRADNQPKMKESNICTQPSKKVITINNPTETEYTQGYKYGKQGWLCLSCNNFNWETRQKCNRCQRVKQKQQDSSEGTQIKSDPQSDIAEEQPDNQSDPKASKKPILERPGDWICEKCKNLNFSFRNVCNRCQITKEESEKRKTTKPNPQINSAAQRMNLFMLQYSNFIKPMINNKMIPPKNIIHTGPILQTYNFNTFNSFQNVNPSFNNYYVNPVPCANSVSCHDVHGKAGIGNCAQTGLNKQGIGKTPDCDGVGKGKSELD